MPRKSNYPDWVNKHLKKGTYISHVKGKYYLYAAHSERIKGTDKVKMVHDGYLGRITEEDGFIPTRDKVSGEVLVYAYGYAHLLTQLGENVYLGFKRKFKVNADRVFVCSILLHIYGDYSLKQFESSYLSIQYGHLDFTAPYTKLQLSEIQRGATMLTTLMETSFDDVPSIREAASSIYQVRINKKFYRSALPMNFPHELTDYFKEEL